MVRPNRGAQRHRQEHHRAAFALIVRTQNHHRVLDRHNDREHPEDEREKAENVGLGQRNAVRLVKEHFLERVQRGGANVAIHDANGAEGEGCESPPGQMLVGVAACGM